MSLLSSLGRLIGLGETTQEPHVRPGDRAPVTSLVERANQAASAANPYSSAKAIRLYTEALGLDRCCEAARRGLDLQDHRQMAQGIRPRSSGPGSPKSSREERQRQAAELREREKEAAALCARADRVMGSAPTPSVAHSLYMQAAVLAENGSALHHRATQGIVKARAASTRLWSGTGGPPRGTAGPPRWPAKQTYTRRDGKRVTRRHPRAGQVKAEWQFRQDAARAPNERPVPRQLRGN